MVALGLRVLAPWVPNAIMDVSRQGSEGMRTEMSFDYRTCVFDTEASSRDAQHLTQLRHVLAV